MPAACKPWVSALPMPPAASVTIAALWVSVMAWSLPLCLPPSYFRFEGRALEMASEGAAHAGRRLLAGIDLFAGGLL
jgi:hypothetical protein